MESPWQNSGYLLSLTTMYTQQFVAPRDYFWPIKEKSLVINPNLVQNPGWQ
ncbi:RagB/SusD family nutrient uptake outer membrane protein [Bacteroides salyersiae]|nr:RagB/SusD family nutrient uptake outer membrane protein [Bacteroides salyersiae]